MRHIVNFGLLFCFVTLAITGVMSFVFPFSLVTTRIHVVFGLATTILVGMHLASRAKYFQTQLFRTSKQKISQPALIGVVAAWALLLATAFLDWRPAQLLISLGYESRHKSEIARSSPGSGFIELNDKRMIVVPSREEGHIAVSLIMRLNDKVVERREWPTMAVWVETTAGAMISTIYLDPAIAFSDLPDWSGKPTSRNEILPIWRHRYTLLSGVDPFGKVDGVTGATDGHSFRLDNYLKIDDENEFVLCVELNLPNDSNANFDDEHLGQPSVIYTSLVEVDSGQRYRLLELTGHGADAESSGAIRYDLDKLTTAKEMVDLLLLRVD